VRPKASWAGLICHTCLHLKRHSRTLSMMLYTFFEMGLKINYLLTTWFTQYWDISTHRSNYANSKHTKVPC